MKLFELGNPLEMGLTKESAVALMQRGLDDLYKISAHPTPRIIKLKYNIGAEFPITLVLEPKDDNVGSKKRSGSSKPNPLARKT